TISVRSAIALDDKRRWYEKESKTHQQRRIALDPETVEVLGEHKTRAEERTEAIDEKLAEDAFVFSYSPDATTWVIPDTVTQRYERMTAKLGIKTKLHNLRHYSATELITAGVDPRTVGGRLGHSGGGATTLKVYSAWVAESDQRAAKALSARMPQRRSRG
ncbi:MAG: tyrosine-type recombinase/integrase, partial [Pseudonocardiaceae bacterium]|nr:tyrosine-type recombinase/integrase [Pseudonocardiaceae bacterium]